MELKMCRIFFKELRISGEEIIRFADIGGKNGTSQISRL